MPFGRKPSGLGPEIDFDAVYHNLIAPAIESADLEPLRADEEKTGGIIHRPMFERLMLCQYAVADLTTANANVFYELGVRHALRPLSTVLLFAEGTRLPFDVSPLRAIAYQLLADGTPADVEPARASLRRHLVAARNAETDSPLFQLVDGLPEPKVDHEKTDVFRKLVHYSIKMKDRLADARKKGVEAIRSIEIELGNLYDTESGVVIDLFLSYRTVEAWQDMVDVVNKMSLPLAATVMVQEQLAFALNRLGQGEKAERVLKELLKKRGPSSETYGILGRVYKDRWEAACTKSDYVCAAGLIEDAIDAYLRGFETDWRDAYPGVNAVTLMELREPPDERRKDLIPVVSYAVDRKIASGNPDYWDYATRLELAILEKDEKKATKALAKALACIREIWEPKTTARNLRLIREARKQRAEAPLSWAEQIENELNHRSQD